jgi:D-amino-acid dehydrogenase
MRTIVLGAGVVGVCSAYYLHRAGHEVTVLERREAAGDGTSWGNAALLHPCSIQPWAAPGATKKLLRWMGREDAPMLLRPRALPRMMPWGLAFLRAANAPAMQATTLHNLALALETREAMAAIRAETGIAYDYVASHAIMPWSSIALRDTDAAAHEFMAAGGLKIERLDRDQVTALDPAFAAIPADKLAGAVHFPQTDIGDCPSFAKGLVDWLAARGVSFRFGATAQSVEVSGGRVTGVRTDDGALKADNVVVALASDSKAMLAPLGIRLNVMPVKGVSFTFPREAWPDAPRWAVMDHERFYALTPVGDRIRLAGSAEFGFADADPTPSRLDAVLRRAAEMFPAVTDAARHPGTVRWAGFRPVMPNGRAVVGPTGVPGLYLNTGHGHMGWTLAAGSGQRLAAAMAERSAA